MTLRDFIFNSNQIIMKTIRAAIHFMSGVSLLVTYIIWLFWSEPFPIQDSIELIWVMILLSGLFIGTQNYKY